MVSFSLKPDVCIHGNPTLLKRYGLIIFKHEEIDLVAENSEKLNTIPNLNIFLKY